MLRHSVAGLFALTFLAGAPARAQDLPHYLKLRHQNHVEQTSNLSALQDAANGQVLELQGSIQGSFRVGEKTTLILGHPGFEEQPIETDFVPDWLVSSNEAGRFLVKSIRPDQSTSTRAVLLAVVDDAEISKLEAAAAARTEAARPKPHPGASRVANPASFGDGGLYGTISRGGSRMERRQASGPVSPERAKLYYAAYIQHENPRLSNEAAILIADKIIDRCSEARIDPRLVVAIMIVESGFDPSSVSSTGAVGLGQLMPGTAKWMGVTNSYDIEQNIYGMVKLLRTLYVMFEPKSSSPDEALVKTLAAYNAGDGAVRRSGGIPSRGVEAYVRHVLTNYARLRGD